MSGHRGTGYPRIPQDTPGYPTKRAQDTPGYPKWDGCILAENLNIFLSLSLSQFSSLIVPVCEGFSVLIYLCFLLSTCHTMRRNVIATRLKI